VSLYRTSLEIIILVPIAVFALLAGLGSYFLILGSFDDFADRTIRQSLQSMSSGIYSIVDRNVDKLNLAGQTGNRKATRIRQVSTLIEIEDFVRKNEIGVIIYAADDNDPFLAAGVPSDAASVVGKLADLVYRRVSLSSGTFYSDGFEFTPWDWRILLFKDAEAYDDLLLKARYFYVATGIVLFLIAIFLIFYLRRAIVHPIHLIVNRFRAGDRPDYHGIRELEFLSDSIGKMMNEIAEHHENLEEQVSERTAELGEKNKILESLSSQLSKYLSPQLYSSIFTGAQNVEVSSRRKKLTIFFSDIAGFTDTADRLESEELTELLNHYLTEMSQIALKHGGTIDKYVGDAIMIFFGDPETKGVKEDALACVKMAIVMRERMHDLADIWRESGIEKPLQVRMGIHTGYCTVGNFGSEDRMDYTIIGGAVR
jgi:hypothetical protein